MRVPKTFLFCGLVFCSSCMPVSKEKRAPPFHKELSKAQTISQGEGRFDPAAEVVIDSLQSVIDSLKYIVMKEMPNDEDLLASADNEESMSIIAESETEASSESAPPKKTSIKEDDPFNKMSLEPGKPSPVVVSTSPSMPVAKLGMEATNTTTSPEEEVAATEEETVVVAPPKPAAPKVRKGNIRFSKTTYDYGTIKEGKVITHSFNFKNVGGQPVKILDASVTCGCTTPIFPKAAIAPGESATVQVTYDSNGKMASQRSTVTLYTDGYPEKHSIFLTGYVMPLWKDEKKTSKPKASETKPTSPAVDSTSL